MSDDLAQIRNDITQITETLSLTPDGDPSRPQLLSRLAGLHMKRFQLFSEPDDIAKTIEYATSALTLTPDGDPSLPRLLSNLGKAHCQLFQRLGEVRAIEKAIEYTSLALEKTPQDDSNFLARLGDLGVYLSERFTQLDQLDDLEKAIEHKSRILTLTPNGHPSLPYRLYSLAASYGVRFQRMGELGDIENMIKYTSQSVDLTPIDDPHLRDRLSNLGTAYYERFKRLGEAEDIEKAIRHESRVLDLTTQGHPDISIRLSSLAVSYGVRFERVGELDDLDKAIEYGSRALTSAPSEHRELSDWHDNLGISHLARFEHLGELGDLERAIELQSRAMDLTPEDHPDLPRRLSNLGLSHKNRFERLGKSDDLDKALEYQSRGITLTPSNHPELPNRLANIATSHTSRYLRLREPKDLDQTVEYESRALELTPDSHPDYPMRLNNIGASHVYRFRDLGNLEDLTKAIDYQYLSLVMTPDGHPLLTRRHFNLASLYMDLFARTNDPTLFEIVLESFQNATQSIASNPREKFTSAFTWARHASKFSALSPLEAYQTAIDLLPQFIWLGATPNQRYEDLRTAQSLAVSAASTALGHSKYETALEWLEHARCVVWNQSLTLRSPLDQLRSSHPDLANRLDTVSNQLHSVSSERLESQALGAEWAAQEHHRLAKEYSQLLVEARSVSGFEDFLRPMKASGLVRAAKDGPIAVINCHKDQCDALVVRPGNDKVQHIPLPNFSHDKAQHVWREMRKVLAQKGLRERGVFARKRRDATNGFEDGLRLIWYGIVSPILDFLGYVGDVSTSDLPHITWCPTGPISFLPLHAAGDYGQPQLRVYNYVVSSYTPTLTALLASSPSSLKPSLKVLGICQEATPGHSPLPGTKKELDYVKAHTQKVAHYTPLVNHHATPTAVLDAMAEHDWVHLACHAHQNVGKPTESGFFLQDGIMTLNSINRRSFKNKGLAFLSACQTATGDETLPDEVVHLASGMLMAGYTSVIGTMWSVHDDDAPLVADEVYGQLMKEGKLGNGEAGRVLHHAVAELRDKVGEKEFGRWVPYIHIGS